MSKRKPERIPRVERFHGVDWFRPVPLCPGSKVLVHGCTKDAPGSLRGWWERESRRYHNTRRSELPGQVSTFWPSLDRCPWPFFVGYARKQIVG
jgi:hypothetical protein